MDMVLWRYSVTVLWCNALHAKCYSVTWLHVTVWVTGYRATGYRLQLTCYMLNVTLLHGYRLQVTGCRLQVTGYRLQDKVDMLHAKCYSVTWLQVTGYTLLVTRYRSTGYRLHVTGYT